MYQTKIKGDRLYHASAEGYGQSIETFGQISDGETPMSLVNVALGSCVTMCVQGYFTKFHHQPKILMNISSCYEDGCFRLELDIDYPLTSQIEAEILAYINEKCRVKQILGQDLAYDISFKE